MHKVYLSWNILDDLCQIITQSDNMIINVQHSANNCNCRNAAHLFSKISLHLPDYDTQHATIREKKESRNKREQKTATKNIQTKTSKSPNNKRQKME